MAETSPAEKSAETPAPPPVETPAAPAPASPIDAGSLAGANMQTAPAPAAPEPSSASPEPPPPATGPTDARGTVFNPAIHRTNPDGSPAVNANGHFYSKLTGRPPKRGAGGKFVSAGPIPPAGSGAPPPATGEAPQFATPAGAGPMPGNGGPDRFEALAETFLQIGYGPMVLAFSEEMRTTAQEHAILRGSLAAWLRASDMHDLPPGLAFALVATGIYLPKLQRPTVKERLALYWIKVKSLFGRLFSRGKKAAATPRAEEAGELEIIDESELS